MLQFHITLTGYEDSIVSYTLPATENTLKKYDTQMKIHKLIILNIGISVDGLLFDFNAVGDDDTIRDIYYWNDWIIQLNEKIDKDKERYEKELGALLDVGKKEDYYLVGLFDIFLGGKYILEPYDTYQTYAGTLKIY